MFYQPKVLLGLVLSVYIHQAGNLNKVLLEPNLQSRLLEQLEVTISTLFSKTQNGKLTTICTEFEALLLLLDCLLRCGRQFEEVPFVSMLQEIIQDAALTKEITRVIRSAVLAVPAFGDDGAFRLWVIQSLKCDCLVPQLRLLLASHAPQTAYLPNAPLPQIGHEVISLLATNFEANSLFFTPCFRR